MCSGCWAIMFLMISRTSRASQSPLLEAKKSGPSDRERTWSA
jgi:hypothetical protein